MCVKAEAADQCRPSWKVIAFAEFQARAASEFPEQWAKASPCFKRGETVTPRGRPVLRSAAFVRR